MTKKYDELKALLLELFQLDQPDLDFGLYRVLAVRRGEIVRYLDRELPKQVSAAFGGYRSADKAELEQQLAQAMKEAQNLGLAASDVELLPKVKDLRERLKTQVVDVAGLEADVYNHLFRFFRRYYSEGDFLSKRVYKKDTYAIPYEGEEVMLHWANKDQYYIKTSEYLKDYAFRLLPDDAQNPMRVHFRLADVAPDEHGNAKAATGKERRFQLAEGDAVGVENGELIIRFNYQPSELAQKVLNEAAAKAVLVAVDPALKPWIALLQQPTKRKDGTEGPSRLRTHLDRYTARNTVDYFIHKDLGGFLRRELDFYIKNEVMYLDDIESATAPRVEQYLSKLRAMRAVAQSIIQFLAQIEEFQKALWLKKKFVVETSWCVTLDRVPHALYPEIASNVPQVNEWVSLFGIDGVKPSLIEPAFSRPLSTEFLLANGRLVVDTRHFPPNFTQRLLATIEQLDSAVDGFLFYGDNFHPLQLMQARLGGRIQCIYIDPPFNTDLDGFAYKDQYKHSSWLSMMNDRIALLQHLMTEDSTLYAHIDYNEKERLRLMLDEHLTYTTEIIWRIGWISGYKSAAAKFIRNHDTIYQYSNGTTPFFNKTYIPYPDGYTRRDGAAPTGRGYPLEDTWNCNELDQLNSIQIMSFSREKVGDQALTQKNENLLLRIVDSSSRRGDFVLDCFLGSGTTAAVAQKAGRKWVGCEQGLQVESAIIPRLKRVLHGNSVGVSKELGWTGGGMFKILRLESYEDTLNNLDLRRTQAQQTLLDTADADATSTFGEDYRLQYMLQTESRGSPSLLNIAAFADPTAYTLDIKVPGSDETVRKPVDLIETFNWLLGLTVKAIEVPETFAATFGKTGEGRTTTEQFRSDPAGPFWFRRVAGELRDERRVLIIWRKLTGIPEHDNLALDEYGRKLKLNTLDSEYDLVYVNGGNNLQNLRHPDDTWKVRLIEEEFQRLMFASEAV